MEANTKIVNSLLSQVALLPGGRDLSERPIIIINANLAVEILNEHLDTVIKYFTSVFSADTRRTGFCVIIDGQKTTWRITRNIIYHVTEILQSEFTCLLVLRPEAFWEKQKVENCTRSRRDGAPIYIPLCRLHKYVNATHLPQELGGTWVYDHRSWINNRFKVEEFVKQSENSVIDLETLRFRINNIKECIGVTNDNNDVFSIVQKLYDTTKGNTQETINVGCSLVELLEKQHTHQQKHLLPIPQDIVDTKERINRLIDIIQGKMALVEDAWAGLKKAIEDIQESHVIEEGVCQVTNWILGPGEMMLNLQQDVGYDVLSAEHLRRHHESLELQCREPYGHYAELLHKLEMIAQNGTHFSEDLKYQKEFMDFVCRSFATRVERRRNILITSARFFRLVSETTSTVYENLVMSIDIEALHSAHLTLLELQECQSNIDILEKELVKEGEKLSDLLSMPVKDALGRELPVNYQGDIVNVQEILDMVVSRRQLFRDSVELQKLTLQQVALIRSYENDAAQAIQWLNELYNVMLNLHCYVGCSVYEIQIQKEEHQCFQETAKGTFEFGCQLLNAALALRQSCKLPDHTNIKLSNTICQCWKRLHAVSQEQLTRLRVSAVFHRNVDKHCEQLKELLDNFCTIDTEDLSKERNQIRKVLFNREKILLEVGRMVRLGRLLKSRLKEPICLSYSNCQDGNTKEEISDDNETSIEAICEKLSKVTQLAEQLDAALCGSQCISESNNIEKLTDNSDRNKPEDLDADNGKSVLKISEDANKSDEDFHTASECTGTSPSRASSFHTASEEGDPTLPWWDDIIPIIDTEHGVQNNNEHSEEKNTIGQQDNEASKINIPLKDKCTGKEELCFEDNEKENILGSNNHGTGTFDRNNQEPNKDEGSKLEMNENIGHEKIKLGRQVLDNVENMSAVSKTMNYKKHIVRQAITGIF